LKNKIKIETDENGITWRKEFSKSAKNGSCVVSTKIAGFRRKVVNHNTMVSESMN
jgi:hypothetical protein